MANLTWDDYVERGAIEAIRVAHEITGQHKVHVFGFCVGGTIAATALAVLAARGQQPAASLTLLTTLLDFSDTGVLEVFIDEDPGGASTRPSWPRAASCRAATWRPPSRRCARTTWSGITSSRTT